MTHAILNAVTTTAATIALLAAPAGASATRNTSEVFTLSGFVPVGSSTVTRDAKGVTMSLRTTGLTPGQAVSVFWVVFNHPENCRTDNPMFPVRCGESDLANAGVDASILDVAGHVVGADGSAGFGAHLSAGDATGAVLGSGLDPAQIKLADIHIIVRDHGPVDPSIMPGQIQSFDVCSTTCADVQFSVQEGG